MISWPTHRVKARKAQAKKIYLKRRGRLERNAAASR